MTSDQVTLFSLLFFVFVFLIWGRWRYDLVAFLALLVALLTGVVPKEQAFSGFGHPATIIIALVLIISRGLSNSGAIELAARYLVDASRKLSTHITIMSGLAAALSALMNNVAALALLMPVAGWPNPENACSLALRSRRVCRAASRTANWRRAQRAGIFRIRPSSDDHYRAGSDR